MARYLFEASYTSDSWKTQIETKANVLDRIQPLIEACGATLDCFYYTFGDRDLIAILDFASPEDAAGFSLAVSAGGSVRSARTTPLITVEQGMTAMGKAAEAGRSYKPAVPGQRAGARARA